MSRFIKLFTPSDEKLSKMSFNDLQQLPVAILAIVFALHTQTDSINLTSKAITNISESINNITVIAQEIRKLSDETNKNASGIENEISHIVELVSQASIASQT